MRHAEKCSGALIHSSAVALNFTKLLSSEPAGGSPRSHPSSRRHAVITPSCRTRCHFYATAGSRSLNSILEHIRNISFFTDPCCERQSTITATAVLLLLARLAKWPGLTNVTEGKPGRTTVTDEIRKAVTLIAA